MFRELFLEVTLNGEIIRATRKLRNAIGKTFENGLPVTEGRKVEESIVDNMKPPSPSMDGGKGILDDIEDAAWDGKRQSAFVITSHSRSKKQDDVADPKADKPQRQYSKYPVLSKD